MADASSDLSVSAGLRVALFLPFVLDPRSSVGRKSTRMLKIWAELGADVHGFALTRTAPALQDWTMLEVEAGELARHRGARRLAQAVRSWDPEVVYTRFSLWAPGVRRLLGGRPLVEEVNTDDRTELRLWSRGAGAYHRMTRPLALGGRAGWVFLTDELRRGFAPAFDPGSTCVITNGIDLRRVRPVAAPANERPRGLFLSGTASPWQGSDKLVRLARQLPEVDFDLVGESGVFAGPPNLGLHAYVTGEPLQHLIERADFAIGTLALHRKQMSQACPLKVREYLAWGIPTIVGYEDPDLLHLGTDDVLQIPNDEQNVEDGLEAIQAFAFASRGRRVAREDLGELDSTVKEAERLRFLSRIG